MEAAAEEIVSNYSGNTEYDMLLKGMIKAFREVLEVKLDEVSTEEFLNEV